MTMPTDNSMPDLDAQEIALKAQLEEIRRKKLELADAERKRKEEAELIKPIVVRVDSITESTVTVKAPYRPDLLTILRETPGRRYGFDDINYIPLEKLDEFLKKVGERPNVSIDFPDEMRMLIETLNNEPSWFIELEARWIKARPGRKANAYLVRSIAGAEWNSEKKYFLFPLTEGHTLFERLQDVDGVIYTPEAHEYINKQINQRLAADKIALLDDAEYDVTLKEGELRPFQRVGCQFIEAVGGRALVAYEMGLGKTWISLAYAIKNNFKFTLIVCPASLKGNWAREVFRLTGEKAMVLSGREPTRSDMARLIATPPRFAIINYDIISTRQQVEKMVDMGGGRQSKHVEERFWWIELLNLSKPELIIVDEAHYIKNTDSNRSQAVRKLRAPHVLPMTGTPVMNRPGELWAILNLIDPEQFPAYETFLRQYTIDGKVAKNVEQLKMVLRSLMIRRLKKDVVKDLPPINRIPEHYELSGRAKRLYSKVMQGVYTAVAEYSASGTANQTAVTNILAQIMRLKQVCAIDTVERTAELATELYDSSEGDEFRKVIIFTQFKAVAYRIGQLLGHEALCFVSRGPSEFVTAEANERFALVDKFQSDPQYKFLVVTEKTTKEGMNITAAGSVIFNDLFWTPAGHEQAEGRAYGRLNAPHTVNSYWMIATNEEEPDGSIAEWIYQLLRNKQAVINQTVEGVESSRDVSVATELISKIKDMMVAKNWRK